MEATIEVTGLHKRFGSAIALDGMTFTPPGQITGFVGPNRAGKSTTMRVILGLDAPDAGTALISGQPYTKLRRPLTHVGSLLDVAAAVRDSALAIGIVLGLLYLFPIIGAAVSNSHLARHIQQLSPMTAGLSGRPIATSTGRNETS